MHFPTFLLTLGLAAVAFPVLYLRGVVSLVERCQAFLAPEASTQPRKPLAEGVSVAAGKSGFSVERLPLLLGSGLLLVLEIYIQSAWSAFSVLKVLEYAQQPGATRWVYYASGFLLCEGALGVIARKDPGLSIFRVLRSVIPMGSFAVFALVPSRIDIFYGWLRALASFRLW